MDLISTWCISSSIFVYEIVSVISENEAAPQKTFMLLQQGEQYPTYITQQVLISGNAATRIPFLSILSLLDCKVLRPHVDYNQTKSELDKVELRWEWSNWRELTELE